MPLKTVQRLTLIWLIKVSRKKRNRRNKSVAYKISLNMKSWPDLLQLPLNLESKRRKVFFLCRQTFFVFWESTNFHTYTHIQNGCNKPNECHNKWMEIFFFFCFHFGNSCRESKLPHTRDWHTAQKKKTQESEKKSNNIHKFNDETSSLFNETVNRAKIFIIIMMCFQKILSIRNILLLLERYVFFSVALYVFFALLFTIFNYVICKLKKNGNNKIFLRTHGNGHSIDIFYAFRSILILFTRLRWHKCAHTRTLYLQFELISARDITEQREKKTTFFASVHFYILLPFNHKHLQQINVWKLNVHLSWSVLARWVFK